MSVNPVTGAGYLLQGIRLIARPGLRRFVAVPLAVNIAVFSAAIWYGVSRFDQFIAWIASRIPDLPDWLSWLEHALAWLLWPLFILLVVVLVFYGFTLVANLIAAPFNSLLAEKVELLLTGRPLDSGSGLKQALIGLVPALVDEARKLLYALIWAVPFLILAFVVPVAGPLFWFLFTAWTIALEYADFPMGNHGLRFREMRRRLRERPLLSLGFGAAAAGLTMVPVANFIAMPSAVAGATAMWVRELDGGSDA